MDQDRKNLKVFGYGLAVILGIVAWRLAQKLACGVWPVVLVAAGAVLAVLTAIDVGLVRPLYVRWMRVARVIGMVVSSLVLTVIFFMVFGSVGLILRVLRKDILSQQWDPDSVSYWIPKEKTAFSKERYLQPF